MNIFFFMLEVLIKLYLFIWETYFEKNVKKGESEKDEYKNEEQEEEKNNW